MPIPNIFFLLRALNIVIRTTTNGTIHKASLVARGFEEFNPDVPKDSPTCRTDSLRLILAALVLSFHSFLKLP
jgi:hypothetical protein